MQISLFFSLEEHRHLHRVVLIHATCSHLTAPGGGSIEGVGGFFLGLLAAAYLGVIKFTSSNSSRGRLGSWSHPESISRMHLSENRGGGGTGTMEGSAPLVAASPLVSSEPIFFCPDDHMNIRPLPSPTPYPLAVECACKTMLTSCEPEHAAQGLACSSYPQPVSY